MKSIISTSLVVLPTLAYGLTTPGIENVPVAPLIFPDEDNRVESDEAFSPSIQEYHESSTKDTLMEIAEPTNKETYPRPTLPWLSHLPRPELGSVPYGEILTSCTKPNTIALTFDDGPWKYTSDLLDLLESSGARATFFVCGGNMADGQLTRHGYPSLLRRMVTEGHQVGTHTWSHADLATLDEEDITSQLLDNEQALVQDLGFIPTYFRPPYFSSNEEALDIAGELGYHVVNAGVDTRDWTGDYDAARENFDEAIREDKRRKKGKIVLAHDIKEKTAHELAEYMIEQADEHGYRLVTVGECLDDPPRNWYRSPSTGESWLSRTHGSSRGHGRGHGRGRDRVLGKRAVIPPPDAPKEDTSSDPAAFTTSGHRLHAHTLPPPTAMENHKMLVQRAEEAPNATNTKVPTGTWFDPCPYIDFEDLGPWLEWCCDGGYNHCPWRTAEIGQETAEATPYMLLDVVHQPTPTPATTILATAADPIDNSTTIHTIILGHLCKRPYDECTPVYKTVTRIVDYVDGRPTGTTTYPSGQSASATDDSISVHTMILGHLCKRPHDECTLVYKTVTRIIDYVDGSPSGMAAPYYPEGLAATDRATPTVSDFPIVQLPPFGGNIPPALVRARFVGDEGATGKSDKRSAVVSPDMVDELTVVLDNDMGDSSEVVPGDMDDQSTENRRREGEGQGERDEAGEGQNHNEQQHQHEKGQEEDCEHHSTASAKTADGEVPVTAGAVRASTAGWGLVLVVVANLYFLFY